MPWVQSASPKSEHPPVYKIVEWALGRARHVRLTTAGVEPAAPLQGLGNEEAIAATPVISKVPTLFGSHGAMSSLTRPCGPWAVAAVVRPDHWPTSQQDASWWMADKGLNRP